MSREAKPFGGDQLGKKQKLDKQEEDPLSTSYQQRIPECGSFADELFKSQLQEINAVCLQPLR